MDMALADMEGATEEATEEAMVDTVNFTFVELFRIAKMIKKTTEMKLIEEIREQCTGE